MKKTVFYFLTLCSLCVAMVSCDDKTKSPIISPITNRYVLDLEVNNTALYANSANYATVWQPTTDGAFVASFSIPELTNEAYNDGLVSCYVEFNTATPDAYQEQLPFIYFDQSQDSQTGEVFQWSRLLDFDYTVGQLNIYYTNNDFNYITDGANPEPGLWHFRLVMIW